MTDVFSLATISHEGASAPVIEAGGKYWLLRDAAPDLAAKAPRGLIDLFADWDRSFDALAAAAKKLTSAKALDTATLKFLTPLQYPNKVLCTGTNYYDHLRAVGRTSFTKEDNDPAFFFKPPTTALTGPGDIRYPQGVKQYDWEIELAAVFGKKASRVKEGDALDHVAGYAVAMDMSARDLQRNQRHFAKMDLCLGKGFDDACPLGPRIVPAQFVGDPQKLSLKLWVNDKIEQDSNTGHMIWTLAEQIEGISKYITFEPGDVLLTGTPAGCGIESGRYLSIGDRIDAEIASKDVNFGRLSVKVVEQ
jgi:2-keto-4-pentenoate hydratase/2-oxohepta-3-ene-1,7-dioic acid hydratase in catechol pathway